MEGLPGQIGLDYALKYYLELWSKLSFARAKSFGSFSRTFGWLLLVRVVPRILRARE